MIKLDGLFDGNRELELVGLYCSTNIQPRNGYVIAWRGQILDEQTAQEIRERKSLQSDLRLGCRKTRDGRYTDVFQASLAAGTGLVDADGKVY
jgi:hypothetical protein